MADPAHISDDFPPAAEAGPPPVLAAATADHADREPREFTPLERFAVWNKAREAHPLNCAYWRLDESGNLMAWGDFGDAQSLPWAAMARDDVNGEIVPGCGAACSHDAPARIVLL